MTLQVVIKERIPRSFGNACHKSGHLPNTWNRVHFKCKVIKGRDKLLFEVVNHFVLPITFFPTDRDIKTYFRYRKSYTSHVELRSKFTWIIRKVLWDETNVHFFQLMLNDIISIIKLYILVWNIYFTIHFLKSIIFSILGLKISSRQFIHVISNFSSKN